MRCNACWTWKHGSFRAVLFNRFDLAGHKRNNHEAAGRTSKLNGKDYNLLNIIGLLYLCNCNFSKSGVVHNVCHATLDKFLPIPCHKIVTNLGPLPLSRPISHLRTKKISNSIIWILNQSYNDSFYLWIFEFLNYHFEFLLQSMSPNLYKASPHSETLPS